jgi:Transposase DDE domain
MRERLKTEDGIAAYRQRGHIAETPHGHIKHNMGFRQLSVRGKRKASAEWTFACAVHNLFKALSTGHLSRNGRPAGQSIPQQPAWAYGSYKYPYPSSQSALLTCTDRANRAFRFRCRSSPVSEGVVAAVEFVTGLRMRFDLPAQRDEAWSTAPRYATGLCHTCADSQRRTAPGA